jgi:hypothetical protein
MGKASGRRNPRRARVAVTTERSDDGNPNRQRDETPEARP